MIITLPETNSSHLNIDGWKMSFLLGWPICRGYVSFRECITLLLLRGDCQKPCSSGKTIITILV